MEMEPEHDFFNDKKLELSRTSLSSLLTIAKWSKFFAVLGFIMIGLMVIAALFLTTYITQAYGNMPNGGAFRASPKLISVIYIIMAVIYFFPVRFLFLFASKMEKGINHKKQIDFDKSLEALKSHFTFVGVVTIVIISIYVLMIVGFIITTITMR